MLKEPSIMPEFVQSPCPKPTFLMAGRGWNPGFSAFPGGVSQVLNLSLTHPLRALGLSYPHVPMVTGDVAGHQTPTIPLIAPCSETWLYCHGTMPTWQGTCFRLLCNQVWSCDRGCGPLEARSHWPCPTTGPRTGLHPSLDHAGHNE